MDIFLYKNEFFTQKSVQFVYKDEPIIYDFDQISYQLNNEDENYIRFATHSLIDLLKDPITSNNTKNKEKCNEAYTYITRLGHYFHLSHNDRNQMMRIIDCIKNSIREKREGKYQFYDCINEFLYSCIPPKLLVSILYLLYEMMDSPDYDFFMPIFTDNFISDLLSHIDQPTKHIFQKFQYIEDDYDDDNNNNDNSNGNFIQNDDNSGDYNNGEDYIQENSKSSINYDNIENCHDGFYCVQESNIGNIISEVFNNDNDNNFNDEVYNPFNYNNEEDDDIDDDDNSDHYYSDEDYEPDDICSIRKNSSKILINLCNIYSKLNENDKARINLPNINDFFYSILNGINATVQANYSSPASEEILGLLLTIIYRFKDSLHQVERELIIGTFVTLLICAKNPTVAGNEYAIRSLYNLNINLTKNIYSTKDFDEIFKIILYPNFEYVNELMAFVHSVFFSDNYEAIETIIESLQNPQNIYLMKEIANVQKQETEINFVYMSQDFLQLRFLNPKKQFSMSNSELIKFFDSIGLIKLLALKAQNSEFSVRREALFTLLTTFFQEKPLINNQFCIEIIRNLINNFDFIDNLIPFISLDMKMFSASTIFLKKIFLLIESFKDDDARALYSRILNANVKNEIFDAAQQFEFYPLYQNCLNDENDDQQIEGTLEDQDCTILATGQRLDWIQKVSLEQFDRLCNKES